MSFLTYTLLATFGAASVALLILGRSGPEYGNQGLTPEDERAAERWTRALLDDCGITVERGPRYETYDPKRHDPHGYDGTFGHD